MVKNEYLISRKYRNRKENLCESELCKKILEHHNHNNKTKKDGKLNFIRLIYQEAKVGRKIVTNKQGPGKQLLWSVCTEE